MAQTINVDVTPSLFQPTLYYHQGDIGRQFAINISTKDGYEIPSGATVKIEATKPSGFGFSVEGTLSGNTVTFVSTEGMTDEWGRFPAQLEITSGNTVIYTANFLMVGEKDTHPASTVDGSQEDVIPQLTLLVERVENAAAAVLDTTTVVETLPAGSQATYSFDEETNTATFGIPEGEAGAGSAGVVASTYSASKTYAVGDYAIHNSNLYRCTTAITTAESFTASHWTQVVLADDVTDLKSDIDYIGDIVGIEETLVSSNSDFINVNQCYKSDGSLEGYSGWNTTDYIDCHSWDSISFDLVGFNEPSMNITLATIAFFDESKSFISAIAMETTGSATFSGTGNIPASAYYFKALGNSSVQTNPSVSLKKGGTIIEDISTLQAQYTNVSNSVDDLQNTVDDLQNTVEKESTTFNSLAKSDKDYVGVSSFSQYTVPKYYDIDGNEYDGGTGWKTTPLLPCYGFRAMSFHVWRFYSGLKMASIAFFDADKEFISGVWANYLPDGQGEFVGQCAIPDNAYYYCAVTNTGEQSYTPNVTLHRESVDVDLTGLYDTGSTVYTRLGADAQYSGWYTTQYVPVDGFKSLTYVAGGYHGGDVQLESVTFFGRTGETGERIDGVFASMPDNNPRNNRGTVPIPPNAMWVKLLYNSSESELPSLTLHNPENTPINIVCIGDSITEGQTAGAVTLTDNYPSNMQKNLGLGYTVFNAGVGGSQAMTWWSTWRSLLNLKSYNTDVIIIMLGANGGFEPSFDTDVDAHDSYEDYGNSITGKTCALIEWLQEQVPNAEIVMATPTYVDASIASGNAREADNQCLYMPEVIKRYHMPLIDIRNLMGINAKNCTHWLASDGLHGTPIFYQKLGMLFANQIKPIINIPNK